MMMIDDTRIKDWSITVKRGRAFQMLSWYLECILSVFELVSGSLCPRGAAALKGPLLSLIILSFGLNERCCELLRSLLKNENEIRISVV